MAKQGDVYKGVALGALIVIAAIVGVGMSDSTSLNTLTGNIIGDGDTGNETEDGVDMVATADYSVDGEVPLPTSVTTADVYLFETQPDGDAPVHHGDYVDFTASEATSGLTDGVDYEKVSLSSSDAAKFTDLDAGDYFLVLVDKSSPREYHYRFGEVSMPSQVAQFRVEQDQPVKLIDKSEFDRFSSYDSDSATIYDSADEAQKVASNASDVNFDDPSTNTTDRVRSFTRTIEYSSGQDYLGKIVAENLNTGDGVNEIVVTVRVDGEEQFSQTLLDTTTDEFGDDDAFSEHLADNPQHSPIKAGSTVEIEAQVVYDANTAVNSAGDSEVGPGESIVDIKVTDIYDNVIGDEPTSFVVG